MRNCETACHRRRDGQEAQGACWACCGSADPQSWSHSVENKQGDSQDLMLVFSTHTWKVSLDLLAAKRGLAFARNRFLCVPTARQDPVVPA